MLIMASTMKQVQHSTRATLAALDKSDKKKALCAVVAVFHC